MKLSCRTASKAIIISLNYRRDMSNRPTLFKGTTPADQQDTMEAALIYALDLKEFR